MTAHCTYPGCGSYALNIAPESGLCDVHFYKVQCDDLLEALINLLAAHEVARRARLAVGPSAGNLARAAIAKATGSLN